jgi:phenylpropionate dioxygenase-like ring-hydroxylating dioxygenase large terminal subunit
MNTTTSAENKVVGSTSAVATDPQVEALLTRGLYDLWYPICPSDFVKERPISVRRLGYKIAVWRDAEGTPHALEDHCPHRGAPLSQGVNLGDRLACPYHGIEVRCDGIVTRVPASPGCTLEGHRAARHFQVQDRHGVLWLYNAKTPTDAAPELRLPDELESPEWSHFLCYNEWKGDYRYVADNVMDPMHGTFLHKQSHSMAEGDISAKFNLRKTATGFMFEKAGQRDVNFDWTEWADTGAHWMRLSIPYPKTGGPGGSFHIIGSYAPISPTLTAVFFWRCRHVQGWHRDVWRFLYRNRLEARHWGVLEQDRVLMEAMEPDAREREHLYAHDVGLSRLRKLLEQMAAKQIGQR